MCESIRIHDYLLWFASIIAWLTRRFLHYHKLWPFRSGLSKLSYWHRRVSEKCLCCRQRLSEEKLLKCYAEEVSAIISMMVLENCEGCRVDHPSQRQHAFNDGRRSENVAIFWQCLGGGGGGKGCWNVHEQFTRLKTNCEWTWAVKVYMSRLENIVLHEE